MEWPAASPVPGPATGADCQPTPRDAVTQAIFRAALSLHSAAEATNDPAISRLIHEALADLDTAIQALNDALRRATLQRSPGAPHNLD